MHLAACAAPPHSLPPCRALPGMGGSRAGPAPEDVAFVQALLEERGTHRIPHNFVPTAPAYDPSKGPRQRGHMPAQHVRNPQVSHCPSNSSQAWGCFSASCLLSQPSNV
jgi:hypothetical protein